MSVNKFSSNVSWNLFSQLYVAIIGIVVVPVFLKLLGAESYGLIMLYSAMMIWFSVLDMGMVPTISRQTSCYVAGTISTNLYQSIYSLFSCFVLLTALVAMVVLWGNAGWLADNWVEYRDLSDSLVTGVFQLIAVIVALRWCCGLYRGVVIGAEQIRWLSQYNIVIATLRFVVILPLLYFKPQVQVFFQFQLIIAVIELLWIYLVAKPLLPAFDLKYLKSFHSEIRTILKFAGTIAITTIAWISVSQIDRFLLSKTVDLTAFGYFATALTVASVITMVSATFGTVLMPRLTTYFATERRVELLQTYKQSTQFVVVICSTVASICCFGANNLLFAWTGDQTLVQHSANILSIYAVGNLLLSISAFPYYLQFARGNLKYHLWGHALLLLLLIPGMVLAVNIFGAIGAAYCWLVVQALYFLIWLPFTHARLYPGLHLTWLTQDVLRVVLPVFFTGLVFSQIIPANTDRIAALFALIALGFVSLLVAVISSSSGMALLRSKWKLSKARQ